MARTRWRLRMRAPFGGAVAQLGERLVRNEEVRGSTPLGSTSIASNNRPDDTQPLQGITRSPPAPAAAPACPASDLEKPPAKPGPPDRRLRDRRNARLAAWRSATACGRDRAWSNGTS